MKTFFQVSNLSYLLVLIILTINLNLIESDLIDDIKLVQNEEIGDFWNWVFGDDTNSTNEHNKPLDHIREELQHHYGVNYLDDKAPDLQQELYFHMFNLHDFDKNKKLDGLEMLSMMAQHDDSQQLHQTSHTMDQNIAMIDTLLKSDDTNNDGYLDYNEFNQAKSKYYIKGFKVDK